MRFNIKSTILPINKIKYPVSIPSITALEKKFVNEAINSGWVSSLGPFINKFEDKFSKYIGCEYSLCTSSGTTALHLALASLGIKEGDEVIIPNLTFVATSNAVSYTGAKPIIIDVERDTGCLDINLLKESITKYTKAIIPVHLYGNPAKINEICEIAKNNDIKVVEDVSEALGAKYGEKTLGSIGDIGCFSLYGNKIITSGEGGVLTTNNKNIYEKAKYLRDHAMSKEKRYWHTEIGYNYRMTNLQAALAYAQLTRVDEILEKRWDIYLRYESNLQDSRFFDFYKINKDSKSNGVNWLTSIIFKEEFLLYKEEVIEKLKQKGIDSRSFFYPMSKLPIHESYNKQNFKISEYLSKAGLSLPTYDDLSTKDIDIICSEIKGVFSGIFNS